MRGDGSVAVWFLLVFALLILLEAHSGRSSAWAVALTCLGALAIYGVTGLALNLTPPLRREPETVGRGARLPPPMRQRPMKLNPWGRRNFSAHAHSAARCAAPQAHARRPPLQRNSHQDNGIVVRASAKALSLHVALNMKLAFMFIYAMAIRIRSTLEEAQ